MDELEQREREAKESCVAHHLLSSASALGVLPVQSRHKLFMERRLVPAREVHHDFKVQRVFPPVHCSPQPSSWSN